MFIYIEVPKKANMTSLKPGSSHLNGTLHFTIQKAKGLANVDMHGLSNPLVSIEVNGEKLFHTRHIKNNLDPEWIEKFGPQEIDKPVKTITFNVRSKMPIGSRFMASCTITGKEIADKNNIGPDDEVGQWYDLLDKREKKSGKIELAIEYKKYVRTYFIM